MDGSQKILGSYLGKTHTLPLFILPLFLPHTPPDPKYPKPKYKNEKEKKKKTLTLDIQIQ